MNQDDYPRFKRAFGTLAEVWEKDASGLLVAVYYRALESFSIEEIEQGISTAISTLKFWPKPVELIEVINGGSPQDIEDRAVIQAHQVLDAIRRIGCYKSVEFGDRVTNAVIKQVYNGWHNLCSDLQENQSNWFTKDFMRYYAAYSRQGIWHDGHLPGLIEIQNGARGYGHEFDSPVLIGGEYFKQLPN